MDKETASISTGKSQSWFRLTPEAMEKLEAALPPIFVTEKTTEHQAGFQLGIAFVLDKLRKGYVIGT